MGVNMKTIEMKQLGEKDEEIAGALISLGMSRNVARILSYLKSSKEVKSVELEREAGLRQPEVSLALRELKGHGWISEQEEKKKPGKGRPNKVYSLKVSFNEIIAQPETQQRKTVNEAQAKMKRLTELGK